jgi:hypothetical protein
MKCKTCHKKFKWADEIANMALRDKTTEGLCKDCRRIITNKILKEKTLQS